MENLNTNLGSSSLPPGLHNISTLALVAQHFCLQTPSKNEQNQKTKKPKSMPRPAKIKTPLWLRGTKGTTTAALHVLPGTRIQDEPPRATPNQKLTGFPISTIATERFLNWNPFEPLVPSASHTLPQNFPEWASEVQTEKSFEPDPPERQGPKRPPTCSA